MSKKRVDVREDLRSIQSFSVLAPPPKRRSHPSLVLLAALLTVLTSIAVCVVAVLAPAPAAALPVVVAICVGCPVFAGWEVPTAIASLRADRAAGRALDRLRRSLAQLPETEHPLGL